MLSPTPFSEKLSLVVLTASQISHPQRISLREIRNILYKKILMTLWKHACLDHFFKVKFIMSISSVNSNFPTSKFVRKVLNKKLTLQHNSPIAVTSLCYKVLTSLFLLSICFLLFGKTQNKKYQFSVISYTMRISPHTGILKALSKMWWCQLALYKPQKLGSMAHNLKRDGSS